jgi:hypothetical protein
MGCNFIELEYFVIFQYIVPPVYMQLSKICIRMQIRFFALIIHYLIYVPIYFIVAVHICFSLPIPSLIIDVGKLKQVIEDDITIIVLHFQF